jgi:hypothetical protein
VCVSWLELVGALWLGVVLGVSLVVLLAVGRD